RACETQPLDCQRPAKVTDHAASRPRKEPLPTVKPRPLKTCARRQQQDKPAPESRTGAEQTAPDVRRCLRLEWGGLQPTHHAIEPSMRTSSHAPPDGKTKKYVSQVRKPSTELSGPVLNRAAGA